MRSLSLDRCRKGDRQGSEDDGFHGRPPLSTGKLSAAAARAYMRPMQTQNPFLDEAAKAAQAAMGIAQSAGREAKAAMRAQADRFVADMDLVRRDELEAVKAELAAMREELAALRAINAAETRPNDAGR